MRFQCKGFKRLMFIDFIKSKTPSKGGQGRNLLLVYLLECDSFSILYVN